MLRGGHYWTHHKENLMRMREYWQRRGKFLRARWRAKKKNKDKYCEADGKIKKMFWSLHLPRKTYREGENYYGTFPEGFEKKLKELGLLNGKVVNLCSGMSELGQIRVDICSKTQATLFEDARHTSLPNECADFVMLDAYYSDEDYIKVGQTPVSIYEFLQEAVRICKNGGQIGVLHNRPPRKPKGTKLTHLIAISVGPDRLLRCFQVFKKVKEK